MRKILVALMVYPLMAFAQGPQGQPQGQPQGGAQGPGAGFGPGRGDPARMEKRMRLARTLGLAEALDLDPQQALKLGDTLKRFDDRRLAARRQLHDARQVLFKAASGEKATTAEVDAAIQRIFDARAQLQASDREMLQAIAKDLPAEKRARAALFLGRFGERIEPRGMRHGPGAMRGGRMGMGPGPGMGMGPGGRGMGWAGGDDDDCPRGGDCPMENDD
ncbi:Spy/CpxP family protein refolding chaperone [Anaeromyxobacter oryzisoli]|uniref:Spy/CpxP family protein refolding chaperone n=1 Tax=Anaeromyxobacter oryzisoli TaxID=2925408 RepID=UPI001F566E59|nr:periplasmic heavy metal sensor [Anaeromyxobacter sp. SG63]